MRENKIEMKKIVLVFILFLNFSAFAQQDELFSQYMFNKLLINPAYAGSREVFTVDVLSRYQWVGIDGAPNTTSVAFHTLTANKRVGLGAYIYSDDIGPTTDLDMMLTYSYRVQTRKGWFSFGLQGGIKYSDFDWDEINTQYSDVLYDPDDVRKMVFDVNFGVYYQTSRFFAGLSSKQLLENEYGSFDVVTTESSYTSFELLSRHFYGMTGFAIPINDKMTFRPSTMARYVENAPFQMDFNASIIFNDIFWVGVSYRTSNAVVFLTEFQIAKTWRLGYSFDLYLNELQTYNNGTHEFRLSFDLFTDKNRMKTPRYF